MCSNVREKICAYSITWSARASKVAGTARPSRSRCLKIDCKLEFDVKVIPHKGDTDWIEPLIFKMNDCLRGETIPAANPTCEYCGYREAAGKELQARVKKPVTKSNKSATLGI